MPTGRGTSPPVVLADVGDEEGNEEAKREVETYVYKCGKREDARVVGRGEIGEGTLYGLSLSGGGDTRTVRRRQRRTGSLSLKPSAKIAHGNSTSRHASPHRRTPVTPAPSSQKYIFPLHPLPVLG